MPKKAKPKQDSGTLINLALHGDRVILCPEYKRYSWWSSSSNTTFQQIANSAVIIQNSWIIFDFLQKEKIQQHRFQIPQGCVIQFVTQ